MLCSARVLALSCASLTLTFSALASAKPRTKRPILLEWRPAHGKDMCRNFQAGREQDGAPLYVSQTYLPEAPSSVPIKDDGRPVWGDISGNWYLGKAGPHLRGGMAYAYDGIEKELSRKDSPKSLHYVLCWTKYGRKMVFNERARVRWVAARPEAIHDQAIRGFNWAEKHMVCRAKFKGGVHPGRVEHYGACQISWGGREYRIKNFEVPVLDVEWPEF